MLTKLTTVVRQQALGALALFVALGGTSYAVATGSIDSREIKNSSIRSKDIRNGQVRSSDVRNGSLLRKDFGRGQIPAGATGPQGAPGLRGLPGQNATKLFAYISDDGPNEHAVVAYGPGVTAVSDEPHPGTKYVLTFNRSVRNCVVHATSGYGQPIGDGGLVVPAVPQVSGVSGNDNQFEVRFYGLVDPTVDTSFLVSALC